MWVRLLRRQNRFTEQFRIFTTPTQIQISEARIKNEFEKYLKCRQLQQEGRELDRIKLKQEIDRSTLNNLAYDLWEGTGVPERHPEVALEIWDWLANNGDLNSALFLWELHRGEISGMGVRYVDPHKTLHYAELLKTHLFRNYDVSRDIPQYYHVLLDLAERQYLGISTPVNYQSAFDIWSKIFSRSNENQAQSEEGLIAMAKIGTCFYEGKGVEQNVEKAIEIWEAIAPDHPEAHFLLGQSYFQSKKWEQSFHHLNLALENGYNSKIGDLEYYVGVLYHRGRGVTQNTEIAIQFYSKAMSVGHQKAKEQIELLDWGKKNKNSRSNFVEDTTQE